MVTGGVLGKTSLHSQVPRTKTVFAPERDRACPGTVTNWQGTSEFGGGPGPLIGLEMSDLPNQNLVWSAGVGEVEE